MRRPRMAAGMVHGRPPCRLRRTRTLCAAAVGVLAAVTGTPSGADSPAPPAPAPVAPAFGPSEPGAMHAPVRAGPEFENAAYVPEEAVSMRPDRPDPPPVEFPDSMLHRPGEREPLKPIPEAVDVDPREGRARAGALS